MGFFEAGGLGPHEGAYGTPHPERLCLVANGLAYLVDVQEPESFERPCDNIVEVVGAPDYNCLVLASWSDLCAIGESGRVVRSPRLCADDLHIEEITSEGIVCIGDFIGSRERVVVDPTTGQVLDGPAFRWNVKRP